MLFELIVGMSIIVMIIFLRHYIIRKHYPPGPLGFPFLGILPIRIIHLLFPSVFPIVRIYFQQMKEKYGDVWSFEIGTSKIIVLASIDAIKETFVDRAKLYSGRPPFESFKIYSQDCGIVFIGGRLWNKNRQLAIKALRDLGMGKRNVIDDIGDESHEFIDYILNNLSKPLNNPMIFVKSTSNVITKLVFNERNNYDDTELTDYIRNLKYFLSSYKTQLFIDFFPNFYKSKIMRKAFPSIDQFINCNDQCWKFIANKCRSRIEIEKEYSKPSCVFDYFWRYRYQDQPNISYDEKFHNISHTMNDIFDAGVDTVTNMIGFSCLILGQEQTLQNELRKEVHSLVDDYKLINMDMRKNCPRLLSFIDEVQRFCFLVPKANHQAMETSVFRGYKIKTTDIILGDLATISRDPKYFENPDTFDPYRFLDSSRTKYNQSKLFIPFSAGKRVCLGESIANIEIFMFLSKIIHKLSISLPKETQDNIGSILEGKFGIVHVPLEHEIIFQISKPY